MLTCLIGNETINCYDGTHTKEQLKKWSKKKILLCPACGRPYEYCHGKIKAPYFRHMDKEECEDKYSESETEEHMQGKKDLYEWVKNQPGVTNAVLEAWIPETKQRPDIMFTSDIMVYGDIFLQIVSPETYPSSERIIAINIIHLLRYSAYCDLEKFK